VTSDKHKVGCHRFPKWPYVTGGCFPPRLARHSSLLYSRGNTRRVDGERAIEDHLELPAGIKKHNPAAAMVKEYQGNRDPGCGGDPYAYGNSNM